MAAHRVNAQPGGSTVPRLALSYEEAAESLGVSIDTFKRHVLPHVRTKPVGARRLVPVAELDDYLARGLTAA